MTVCQEEILKRAVSHILLKHQKLVFKVQFSLSKVSSCEERVFEASKIVAQTGAFSSISKPNQIAETHVGTSPGALKGQKTVHFVTYLLLHDGGTSVERV